MKGSIKYLNGLTESFEASTRVKLEKQMLIACSKQMKDKNIYTNGIVIDNVTYKDWLSVPYPNESN